MVTIGASARGHAVIAIGREKLGGRGLTVTA
jgi:hypothetical protein